MRTTFTLLGAAAVATTFGLFGCTGAETTSGIEMGGAAGSAGFTGTLPHGHVHVVLPVDGNTAPQGGAGGTTTTAQGGAGGTTTTAQGGDTSTGEGGAGGTTQTLTLTGETTSATTGNAKATPDNGSDETTTPPTTPNPSDTPTTNPGLPGSTPVETPPQTPDGCPGQAVDLPAGTAVTLAGSLKGLGDDVRLRCGGEHPLDVAPDAIYQLDVREELTVRIDLTAKGFLPALSIRRAGCETEDVEDLCIYTDEPQAHADLALSAGRYWFVVDSGDGKVGAFSLAIRGTAAACGDGVVNPMSEECDVGPGQGNDGCYDPGKELECMYGAPYDTAGLNTTP